MLEDAPDEAPVSYGTREKTRKRRLRIRLRFAGRQRDDSPGMAHGEFIHEAWNARAALPDRASSGHEIARSRMKPDPRTMVGRSPARRSPGTRGRAKRSWRATGSQQASGHFEDRALYAGR